MLYINYIRIIITFIEEKTSLKRQSEFDATSFKASTECINKEDPKTKSGLLLFLLIILTNYFTILQNRIILQIFYLKQYTK